MVSKQWFVRTEDTGAKRDKNALSHLTHHAASPTHKASNVGIVLYTSHSSNNSNLAAMVYTVLQLVRALFLLLYDFFLIFKGRCWSWSGTPKPKFELKHRQVAPQHFLPGPPSLQKATPLFTKHPCVGNAPTMNSSTPNSDRL